MNVERPWFGLTSAQLAGSCQKALSFCCFSENSYRIGSVSTVLIRPSRMPRATCRFSLNTPAGASPDCVVIIIQKASGTDTMPPVSCWMMKAARGFLPSRWISSISTQDGTLPVTMLAEKVWIEISVPRTTWSRIVCSWSLT